MYPGIQADFFEKWLPRRATLQVVIGIWVAGFAVAGATVWRMDPRTAGSSDRRHQTARTDETRVISPEVAAAPTEAVSDMAGSESPLFMPVDVIVGHRAPRMGVALRQKR
jgi:hypothetical protein